MPVYRPNTNLNTPEADWERVPEGALIRDREANMLPGYFWTRNEREQRCSGCGERNENHRLIRPANNDAYWLRLCTTCERSRNARRRAQGGTRVPRITSSALGLNRRFGVEIECNVPGGDEGAAARRICDGLPTGWRLKSDGSLGRNGIEIVGGPLQGESGLDELRNVLTLLSDAGATIDHRCGLHVHHEVQDIGRDGLVLFARSWAANQSLLDWLVSPSRRNGANTYCRRLSDSELAQLNDWSGGYGAPGNRYRTVNLHAFPKFGTVEIRQHQGTLSFRKIESWIKLAQGLLDAVAGRSRALGSHTSLQDLFRATRLDEDASAFLLGRAMQFGANPQTLGVTAVAA